MGDAIRIEAAEALRAAAARVPRVVVGFDGFLDSIVSVVGTRRSMLADDYDAIRTIGDLAARIGAAGGGRSTNIELREREMRAGGNGPLLAGGLSAQGAAVTLIGALGDGAVEPVHAAYEPVVAACETAVSIAASARTDALEFEDGKIMFNWSANLDGVDWDLLVERVGIDGLASSCASADAIATINWTNMGGLPSIWRGLRERVLPGLVRRPAVFVDLSDPAKRSDAAVSSMLDDLVALNAAAPLTLGLNFVEANRLSGLLFGRVGPVSREAGAMRDSAVALRSALGLAAVVLHTRGMVAGATAGAGAAVRTRVVERPAISTGAGDHFNAGYLAASARGLGLASSLACGCDTASWYVANGRAPSLHELLDGLVDEAGL